MGEPVFPYNRVTKGQQLFLINNTPIPGVQSITSDYNNNAYFLNHIGLKSSVFSADSNYVGNVNVNALLTNTDQFISYTGNLGFNGYIIESAQNTNKNYSFTSGYLTSYNQRCSIGEIPQVSMGINVFGNMGRTNNTITANESDLLLKIPGPGSITLSFSEFDTNPLTSYNIAITVPRIPIYTLGSSAPSEINTQYPIQVTAEFDINLSDYSPKLLQAYPFDQTRKNLTLTVKDYITDSTINTYTFNNMLLVGESYDADVSKNTVMTLKYQNFQVR